MFTVPMLLSLVQDLRMPIDAFVQSDYVGKGITIALFAISFYLLAIYINKWQSLKGFKRYNISFLRHYDERPHPAYLYLDPRGLICTSPVGKIYKEGVTALLERLHAHGVTDGNLREWKPGETCPVLTDDEIEAIRGVCERALARQQIDIEANMSRISTAISCAPSLGLFGTVWGVMGAFMSMSSGGASMISAVAPGISGALLTTVMGLLVAIPATAIYNIFAGSIRRHVNVLEAFEDRFMSDIVRLHALPSGPQPPRPSQPCDPAPPQPYSPATL